ncbi:MAG: helix-turn-helix domain-containing protein [Lachnospiraceae bacterium]|nr:helix-turn-helix domain-containing protein [Lachnospiraceae bacterium]
MVTELLLMQLAHDQKKRQTHDSPHFPCSAYFTNWHVHEIEGVPWHWHDELEFLIVKEGSVQVFWGNQEHFLQEGDGFFCNSRCLHQIRIGKCEHCSTNSMVFDANLISGGPGTVYDEKYIHPLVSSTAFLGTALFSKVREQQQVLAHIQAAHDSCREEQVGYEYDVRYHLSRALLAIFMENRECLSSGAADGQMGRVRDMLAYVHENYASPITVAELSRAANICERECQRCFRNILRQSPMEYVQQYRIQIAGKLLLETKKSVLETGLAAGFSNPSHFCKIFRKYMGCSPTAFRKRNGSFND